MSREELIRSKSTTRLDYYTDIRFSIMGENFVYHFKVDTGSPYTIIGYDALDPDSLPSKLVKYLSELKYSNDIYSATDDEIDIARCEVNGMYLTDNIMFQSIELAVSKKIGTKCILGLDILSLFNFSYIHEKGQLIGTFWLNDYENSIQFINERCRNIIKPLSIMPIYSNILYDDKVGRMYRIIDGVKRYI